MKEDVGILIRNNYNITVNFEYCLLDTIPAVITYLINNIPTNYYTKSFKNRIETIIIKKHFKNERVCRDIYQNRKKHGTRLGCGALLWQQT